VAIVIAVCGLFVRYAGGSELFVWEGAMCLEGFVGASEFYKGNVINMLFSCCWRVTATIVTRTQSRGYNLFCTCGFSG
jgi:hypothetical protein